MRQRAAQGDPRRIQCDSRVPFGYPAPAEPAGKRIENDLATYGPAVRNRIDLIGIGLDEGAWTGKALSELVMRNLIPSCKMVFEEFKTPPTKFILDQAGAVMIIPNIKEKLSNVAISITWTSSVGVPYGRTPPPPASRRRLTGEA